MILAVFTAGLVIGGGLTAMVLWLLSGLASPVPLAARHAVILLVAVLAVFRDAGLLRLPLPQQTWQVPQHVLRRPIAGALRFGFELGTGVRTYVSASTPYVLAIALLIGGLGAGSALAAGVGFGLGRACTPLVRLLSGDPDAWDARLRRNTRRLVTGAALIMALTLVALLLR
jgi:hypothetical protein